MKKLLNAMLLQLVFFWVSGFYFSLYAQRATQPCTPFNNIGIERNGAIYKECGPFQNFRIEIFKNYIESYITRLCNNTASFSATNCQGEEIIGFCITPIWDCEQVRDTNIIHFKTVGLRIATLTQDISDGGTNLNILGLGSVCEYLDSLLPRHTPVSNQNQVDQVTLQLMFNPQMQTTGVSVTSNPIPSASRIELIKEIREFDFVFFSYANYLSIVNDPLNQKQGIIIERAFSKINNPNSNNNKDSVFLSYRTLVFESISNGGDLSLQYEIGKQCPPTWRNGAACQTLKSIVRFERLSLRSSSDTIRITDSDTVFLRKPNPIQLQVGGHLGIISNLTFDSYSYLAEMDFRYPFGKGYRQAIQGLIGRYYLNNDWLLGSSILYRRDIPINRNNRLWKRLNLDAALGVGYYDTFSNAALGAMGLVSINRQIYDSITLEATGQYQRVGVINRSPLKGNIISLKIGIIFLINR